MCDLLATAQLRWGQDGAWIGVGQGTLASNREWVVANRRVDRVGCNASKPPLSLSMTYPTSFWESQDSRTAKVYTDLLDGRWITLGPPPVLRSSPGSREEGKGCGTCTCFDPTHLGGAPLCGCSVVMLFGDWLTGSYLYTTVEACCHALGTW